MDATVRPVAVVGGVRIPFCRSNTLYADQSNLAMLTATLNGLVDKYNLKGVHIDEAIGGAVVTHSKDWNLAREAILGSKLAPSTPGITLQQACGTSLQAAMILQAKIATGQIECGIAMGSDTTSDAPIVFKEKFAHRLVEAQNAKSFGQRLAAFKGFSPAELAPQPPSVSEPRTGLSMGQHTEMMAQEWQISRADQDRFALESHRKAAEAACVLLASQAWAASRGLPVEAYLTHAQTAANNFVEGEGLLLAPTIAVSRMLERAQLTLQDFDFYEIHEAFAAQVLVTLKAFEDPGYCKRFLGREAALGSIDRSKLNVKGSSLAFGHPFAATGARIIANLGKLLAEHGGRGLISVCTAGGMGVAAIMENVKAADLKAAA